MSTIYKRRNKKLFLIMILIFSIILFYTIYINKKITISIPPNYILEKNKEKFVQINQDTAQEKASHLNPDTQNDKAIQLKIEKEKELTRKTIENSASLSSTNLYKELIRRGIEIDKNLARRMLSETMTSSDWDEISILISTILTEEENFKVEVAQYSTFEEIKKAFNLREKTTGIYYGNEFLQQPGTYKNSTFNDIREILHSGAVLPDNFIELMVNAGNLKLPLELQNGGYSFNSSYINPYTQQSAIELFVSNVSLNPSLMQSNEAISVIDHLLEIGVPTNLNDGTRDALDYALEGANSENVEIKMILAKKLLTKGMVLEASHLEALAKLKSNYPNIYDQYFGI